MWIFTEDGFFSVVEHLEDSTKMLVRARKREDLERFVMRGEGVITNDPTIQETPVADYRFRVVVDRVGFLDYLTRAVSALNYPNFKDRIHQQDDTPRDVAYMEVWGAMHRFQEGKDTRYVGFDSEEEAELHH